MPPERHWRTVRTRPSLQRAFGATILTVTLVAASVLTPTIATAVTPSAPATSVVAAASATPEQQVAKLINKHRKAAKLPELKVHTVVQSAAESWGKHLKSKGAFTHSTSKWRSERISASGWASSGENLAWGYTSAAAAVSAWMKSAGHKKNILGKSYRGVGVGYVKGGKHKHYWVVIFSTPKPSMPKGKTPSVSGTVKVGATVTSKTSGWPSGTKLKWQWLREGSVISGATSSKYTVKAADVGKRLRVKVVASNKHYYPASIASGYTRAVPT